MKKKYIISIIIIALILIALSSYFIYNKIVEEGKKYEIEKIENFNYFVLKQADKYGVIDRSGDIIIDCVYSSVIIPNPQKAVFICENEGTKKILNNKKEEIFKDIQNISAIRLSNIASSLMYEKSVMTYERDNKIGLINFEGKEITKPIYDSVESLPYKEGELIVKQNDKVGIINIKGNELIPIEYDQISVDNYFVENEGYKYSGYIVSQKTQEGYRYGYIDLKGTLVVEPKYNDLSRVTDIRDDETVYLIVAKNGKYGLLKNENLIIPNEYQSIRYDKPNNIFVVEKSKKFGINTIDGKEIVPIKYNQIDIVGTYIYARTDENTEVYDKEGKLTNMDSNIAILETDNENYKIKIDNIEGTTYSIVDKNDKEITKQKYLYLEHLEGDYFVASISEGKLGIIDINENEKIQIKYDSIEKIKDTDLIKASITSDNIIELYTKDFKLIDTISNAIINNEGNYIKAFSDAETKYFDKEGNVKQYNELCPDKQLYAKKLDNGKWTFVNKEGEKINQEYDKVTDFNEYGFAGVKKDGKWGVIGQDGKVLQEPIYEFKNSIEPDFINTFYKVEYGFGEFYYTNDK